MKNLKIILLFVLVFAIACNNKPQEEIDRENAQTKIQEQDKHLELGNKIVEETFKGLSSELMNSINQGGIESAIDYCNLNALPITAKFETTYDVKIKRVGTKIRNELNKPDEIEAEVVKMFQSNVENNKETKPVVMKIGGKYHYFNYIKTKALCLNCHGTPGETIQESIYAKIQEKYPNDNAIGYKENDLRGIWHITFNN